MFFIQKETIPYCFFYILRPQPGCRETANGASCSCSDREDGTDGDGDHNVEEQNNGVVGDQEATPDETASASGGTTAAALLAHRPTDEEESGEIQKSEKNRLESVSKA